MSRRRAGTRGSVAALAALVAATPAGAEWVEWIADAQLDARFDSNLNQAARSSEEEWDLSFQPQFTLGRVYQLAERTRVAATASVAGEIHSRFDALNAAAGEGRASLTHKFGLGDAPWARAFVAGGYQHVEVHQRSGARFTAGAAFGKRFGPRFDARLSYRYTQRWGNDGPRAVAGVSDDVFDQQDHAIDLEGSFLLTESLLLSAGFGYRRGDFDTNAIANRVAVLAGTTVEAVARDEVFGGWVYRIEGNAYEPRASLGWGFDDHWSIDAGYRYRYAEGHGLSYQDHSVRAALLFRY
jgi:opacity protein-like surface antigen